MKTISFKVNGVTRSFDGDPQMPLLWYLPDVGFNPVDAGPLRIARYTGQFELLVAQLGYEGKGGPKLAYRFQRFGK